MEKIHWTCEQWLFTDLRASAFEPGDPAIGRIRNGWRWSTCAGWFPLGKRSQGLAIAQTKSLLKRDGGHSVKVWIE